MKVQRYVIAFVTDGACFSDIVNKLNDDLNKSDVLVNLLYGKWQADTSTFKCLDCLHSGTAWINLKDSLAHNFTKSLQEVQDSDQHSENSTWCSVADRLHKIADSLPYAGCLLDIIIQIPEGLSTNQEAHLPLFGVLRRLKDWHNASITIIPGNQTKYSCSSDIGSGEKTGNSTMETDDAHFENIYSMLKLVLNGEIRSMENIVLQDSLRWRGKLAVIDKTVNRGFILPGFAMKYMATHGDQLNSLRGEDNRVVALGRMLEVVDEVILSTIPHYFFTGHRYFLSLYDNHPHSCSVMEHIAANEKSGMLVRLACYKDIIGIPECGENFLSTSSWKESIVTDITYVQEPEEECFDPHEYLYFIITKHRTNVRSSDMEDCNSVCAYSIKSPSQLSGHVIRHLQLQRLPQQQHSSSEPIESLLSGLPLLNDDSVLWLDNNLSSIQAAILGKWLDENHVEGKPIDMSSLFKILSEVQDILLEKAKDGLPVFCNKPTQVDVTFISSEIDQNPSEWAERKYLQHQESQKKAFLRLQSTDSLVLSSPVQPDDTASSSTLDIKNCLKLFQADGKAAKPSLSPVRRRQTSRSQSKFSSDSTNEPANLQWPDCQDLRYPDIYYNRDRKTERVEMQCNKIRDRYVVEETYSSCSSPVFVIAKETKKKSKEVKGRNFDYLSCPVRRSPRKIVGKIPSLSQLKSPPGKNSLKSPRKSIVSQILKSPRRSQSHLSKTSLDNRKHSITSPRESPRKKVSKQLARIMGSDDHRRQSLSALDGREINSAIQNPRRKSMTAVNERKCNEDANQKDSSLKRRESRSERHKRKLEEIVKDVLVNNGVEANSDIYTPCVQRLYKVTKLFVMDLPTSQNLKEEMRNIAEGQVKQVIDLERKRMGNTEGQSKRKR